MIAEPLYLRGALVAYSSQARSLSDHLAYIPFRFNPESISRSFTADQGPKPTPVDGGKSTPPPDSSKASVSANAPTGLFRESFSLMLRFDVHERDQNSSQLPPDLGIAPEMAALEMLMAPVESDSPPSPKDASPDRQESPTLVLVWGARVTPVRLTALRIDETVYNASLNPVRAEVEASFEVISDVSAQSDFVRGIHQAAALKRRSLANRFQANTSAQSGGTLPL